MILEAIRRQRFQLTTLKTTDIAFMMEIRIRIKTFRLKLGLTQEELAQKLGVSWVTVARWEKKKGNSPSRLALAKLAELGLPKKGQ